jgi:RimJ/RimL family protein N-acetyltransferase
MLIQGERLNLRSGEEEDLPLLKELKDNSYGLERGIVGQAIQRYLRNQKLEFTINDSRSLVGVILFSERFENSGYVMYSIREKFRGRGYASEALNLFIQHHFNNGLDELRAQVDEKNLSSRKVLEKCGFKQEDYNFLNYLEFIKTKLN